MSIMDTRSVFDVLKPKVSAALKETVFKGQTFDEFMKSLRQAHVNENDAKNVMEIIVREVLLQILTCNSDLKLLDHILQLSIDAAMQDMCPGNLPVLVLSDMFDGSTLNDCETIFAFVERRVEVFKKDIFFRACKNQLLRSCNDLLRRLSRSQNTVFCGRILLFLARIFPLSERSGLNIISEFNSDNTTLYSSKDDFDTSQDKDESMEEGETVTHSITADFNLYKKFWSLQEFFRNPVSCYDKVRWRQFTTCTSDILTVFGSFKSDDASSSKWRQTEVSSSQGTFAYFAKYLTSTKLLELELSDSNFRRYLLIQFLILFQYLSSPVKFKMEAHVLTEEQQTWVKEASAKIYKLLEETPPDGPDFSKNIAKILKREEYWNTWKNEGCPDFKSVDEKTELKIPRPKKRLGDELDKPNKVFIGNNELTKLWNVCPNNWEACKAPSRNFVPSMEKYFETAILQADPANQVEARYKDVHDPRFAWKGLRLLAMKSPHFFTVNNVQYKNLPEYLESEIQKIPRERTLGSLHQDINIVDQEAQSISEETIEDGNEESLPPCEEETKEEVEKPRKDGIGKRHIEEICKSEKIQANWKILATQLKFREDEIVYFEETYPTLKERTRAMLLSWADQDPHIANVSIFKAALDNTHLLSSSSASLS